MELSIDYTSIDYMRPIFVQIAGRIENDIIARELPEEYARLRKARGCDGTKAAGH
jgi:hypothetical protein